MFTLKEINHLEMKFLELIDYDVSISSRWAWGHRGEGAGRSAGAHGAKWQQGGLAGRGGEGVDEAKGGRLGAKGRGGRR